MAALNSIFNEDKYGEEMESQTYFLSADTARVEDWNWHPKYKIIGNLNVLGVNSKLGFNLIE